MMLNLTELIKINVLIRTIKILERGNGEESTYPVNSQRLSLKAPFEGKRSGCRGGAVGVFLPPAAWVDFTKTFPFTPELFAPNFIPEPNDEKLANPKWEWWDAINIKKKSRQEK